MDKIKTYHLYPNLLTKDEIIKILIERQIKIPNIESKTYDDVLSIYNKFVLPLSRRKSNRMQVNQMSSSVTASGLETTSIGSNLNNGLEVTRKGHKRIQPPSDTLECENKIQKLKLIVDVKPKSSKRPVEEDSNLMNGLSLKSKRKKITW